MQALQRGALDYVAKPEGMDAMRRVFEEELPGKIRNMAGADVRRILQYRKTRELRSRKLPEQVDSRAVAQCTAGCIAVGVSTGGPPALSNLFGALAPPLPPIVVVQHMPQLFTGPFANRLNSLSILSVKEAAAGDVLRPNCAYVAPGGTHLSLLRRGRDAIVHLRDGEFVSGHKPSVDVMMTSAAEVFGDRCLGVIMTGMGRDGATGCGAIQAAGGFVLGQDEVSSDVYGMNKVAFVEGHVDRQVGLDNLADAMMTEARKRCTLARTMQRA
jgi:two-component system chemotaxis response regulator CheB